MVAKICANLMIYSMNFRLDCACNSGILLYSMSHRNVSTRRRYTLVSPGTAMSSLLGMSYFCLCLQIQCLLRRRIRSYKATSHRDSRQLQDVPTTY